MTRRLYLLSDSQLLFRRGDDGEMLLDRARRTLDVAEPTAAYVGASNGDRPDAYGIFCAALDRVGWTDRRMIPTEPSQDDLDYFERADLVLLAGGDVRRGWRALRRNGLRARLLERYEAGAVVVGVSAGAVQLGTRGYHEQNGDGLELFETFGIVPAIVDAHDEDDGWRRLERCLVLVGAGTRGLGIPVGGGAVLHPDLEVEAVCRPLVELTVGEAGALVRSSVTPGGGSPRPTNGLAD